MVLYLFSSLYSSVSRLNYFPKLFRNTHKFVLLASYDCRFSYQVFIDTRILVVVPFGGPKMSTCTYI